MEVLSNASDSRLVNIDNFNTACDESSRGRCDFVINLEFSKKIRSLEMRGMVIQYQLACLSTLGGAYHLTNRPETAFIIAHKQEMVGRLLGSLSIVIRAKVFQAVNLSLLGYPKISRKVFAACKRAAKNNSWTGMLAFVEASEVWLAGQNALKDKSFDHMNGENIMSGVFEGCAGPGRREITDSAEEAAGHKV